MEIQVRGYQQCETGLPWLRANATYLRPFPSLVVRAHVCGFDTTITKLLSANNQDQVPKLLVQAPQVLAKVLGGVHHMGKWTSGPAAATGIAIPTVVFEPPIQAQHPSLNVCLFDAELSIFYSRRWVLFPVKFWRTHSLI